MACPTTLNAFRIATESLSEDVYLLASYKSIFLNLIPRGTFVRGQGVVRSVFTIGRSEPTTDYPAFTAVKQAVEGNTYDAVCAVTYNDVPVGFNEGTYGPEVFGWKGPVLCEDRMMFDFNIETFIPLYVRAIAKNTDQTISNRFQSIYMSMVPKAVANEDFHFVEGDASINPPTTPVLTLDESLCFISQDHLDETAQILMDAGATDIDTDGWITWGPDGPLFSLYIGMVASKQIMLENAELRADLRYADMGEGNGARTIMRLGAKKTLGNFMHIINLRPPRFSYANGAYVPVPPRVVAQTGVTDLPTATQGTVTTVNPDWISTATAPFEALFVLSPWVYTSEVVPPVTSAGGGVAFQPVNHVGEFEFIIGGREISSDSSCYDPRKKLGAHFAEYWHAPRPIYPIYGRMIIFKRCPITFPCQTCT